MIKQHVDFLESICATGLIINSFTGLRDGTAPSSPTLLPSSFTLPLLYSWKTILSPFSLSPFVPMDNIFYVQLYANIKNLYFHHSLNAVNPLFFRLNEVNDAFFRSNAVNANTFPVDNGFCS